MALGSGTSLSRLGGSGGESGLGSLDLLHAECRSLARLLACLLHPGALFYLPRDSLSWVRFLQLRPALPSPARPAPSSRIAAQPSCSCADPDVRRTLDRGMVKSKGKGGKNRRRGKGDSDTKRELTFKEDGQGEISGPAS